MTRNVAPEDVSVVIPAYASGPWLEEAIESVLAQTVRPREIVVVDDGSPESLEARMRVFGEAVCFVRQENGGPAKARNTGVRRASGAWIAFLDDDDLWEPQKLERQIAALEERAAHGEDIALIGTNAIVFGEGLADRLKEPAPALDLSFEGLLKRNPLMTSTILLCRDAFEAVGGFDEDRALFAVEDFDLWLRVVETRSAAWLAEPLARYRVRGASISDPERFRNGVGLVLEKVLARRGTDAEVRRLVRQRRALQERELAWGRLEAGDGRSAFRAAWAAIRGNPADFRTWKILAKSSIAALVGRRFMTDTAGADRA